MWMTLIMVKPRIMIPTPATRTTVGSARNTAEPKREETNPRVVKARVKPRTKASEARKVTARASLVPRAETGRAEMYDT